MVTMGVVNFNNMIPVTNKNYIEFDLNKESDDPKEVFKLELVKNQLRWITSNRKTIITKSKLLYNLYKINKLPQNVKSRCCNFPLLEEKCALYNN